MNLKDKIKQAQGRKLKTFPVPQWGFSVTIRSWSAKEFQQYAEYSKTAEPDMSLFGRVAAMSLCDEDGSLLFTDEADILALCEKDLDALMLILQEATSFNKVSPQTLEAAKKN